MNDFPTVPATLAGLRPRLPYVDKLIRRHFPPARDSRILDLGCGHGALLYAARRFGYSQLRGVDTSPEQVAAARRLGIEGVEQAEALETLAGLPDRSHDAIVAFDVIEHLRKAEVLRLAEEVSRVLRVGGRFLVHTVNGESPFAGRILYGDFTHEIAFTQRSLGQVLRAAGFAGLACHEDVPVVHGGKSALRWLIWQGVRRALWLCVCAETGDTSPGIFSQNFLTVATR